MVKIFNRRYNDAPEGAFYVGRPGIHGNMFTSIQNRHTLAEFVVGSVEESIAAYAKWFNEHHLPFTAASMEFMQPLIGKDLICWCTPKGGIEHTHRPLICHAQLLASYAESYSFLVVQNNWK